MKKVTGFVQSGNAQLYYESAGQGAPFVMIHAGVADSRQWEAEFEYFAQKHCVIRYDMRGFGRSTPVPGEYSNLADLVALLDHLDRSAPAAVLMGCSMGGSLAMDFTLAHPNRVRALIMVGSSPSGLDLDVPIPPIFDEADRAYKAGDFVRLLELETHIWYDGATGVSTSDDPSARKLAIEMNRQALAHHREGLGHRLPDAAIPAVGRLGQITIPALIIVGQYDAPYLLAAADYMVEHLPDARKVVIPAAAHLPNLNHPAVFQQAVEEFLEGIP